MQLLIEGVSQAKVRAESKVVAVMKLRSAEKTRFLGSWYMNKERLWKNTLVLEDSCPEPLMNLAVAAGAIRPRPSLLTLCSVRQTQQESALLTALEYLV